MGPNTMTIALDKQAFLSFCPYEYLVISTAIGLLRRSE